MSTIIGFEAGTNVSPENKSAGFTHCFVVTFRDEAGRDAYLKAPATKPMSPWCATARKVIVFDYWASGLKVRRAERLVRLRPKPTGGRAS